MYISGILFYFEQLFLKIPALFLFIVNLFLFVPFPLLSRYIILIIIIYYYYYYLSLFKCAHYISNYIALFYFLLILEIFAHRKLCECFGFANWLVTDGMDKFVKEGRNHTTYMQYPFYGWNKFLYYWLWGGGEIQKLYSYQLTFTAIFFSPLSLTLSVSTIFSQICPKPVSLKLFAISFLLEPGIFFVLSSIQSHFHSPHSLSLSLSIYPCILMASFPGLGWKDSKLFNLL